MLRSRLPVRLGYALVYPDCLSRHLARQHQLGILVYRGLDVHSFAHNIKRAAKYALAALVVWLATTLVSVDDSVNFGIIYCMAACTGIVALTDPVLKKISARWGMSLCLVMFALTWSIPKTIYPVPYLAWLGFPSPGFVSGDYYPIIPFIFMYLAGYFAAHIAQGIDKTVPSWAYANSLPALASLGRYALPFYLLHQPIILGILELAYSVR